MPDVKTRFKSEVDAWADSYMNFVTKAMTPDELDSLAELGDPLVETLLPIVPPRVIRTHYVYPVENVRFLVPKNVTLTDKNKDTLARLASDPAKYELKNPVYILQKLTNRDHIIIDAIGPVYDPQ